MEKKWQLKSNKVVSSDLWEDELVDILLENRGIEKELSADFFHPQHPNTITLEEAGISRSEFDVFFQRLTKAKENNEQIVIFGDYDVDGVSATSILWMTLHKLQYNVVPFVPDRFIDGYGIKKATIESLLKTYPDLSMIITVDNGIVAHDALLFAQSKNIDVVVTDHHTKDDQALVATAVIHTTSLCGAAISWLIARELLNSKEHKDSLEKYLAIAGMATIADQMELTGLNRRFAVWGLDSFNNNPPVGLKVLADLAELNPRKIGVYEVGYILAPRLNAAGRIAHALDAVRLLCSPKLETVRKIAQGLSDLNTKRQQIVEDVMASVYTEGEERVLIVWDKPYHEGVIGLAASKLVEKYHRPSIVISKGETISKGSARSISGVNITNLIREAKEYLVDGGGHEMAAGFSINTDNLPLFVEKVLQASLSFIDDSFLSRKVTADCEIPFSLVNEKLLHVVKKFEPTGNGNPAPVFLSKEVVVKDIKPMGSRKNHLKITLAEQKHKVEAVFFNALPQFDKIKQGDTLDIIYRVDKNEWNGRVSIQMMIKDIKYSDEKNNVS